MNNSSFLLKHALIYFTLFLIFIGPVFGYVYAYKKHERDTCINPMQKVVSYTVPPNRMTDRGELMSAVDRYNRASSENNRIKEALYQFSTSQISQDHRIEVARQTLDDLFNQQKKEPTLFTKEWNEDVPSEWIPYSNASLGIVSMSIPYNPAWGNEIIKIPEYEIIDRSTSYGINKRIDFGAVKKLTEGKDGNYWPGGYSLSVISHRDFDEINNSQISSLYGFLAADDFSLEKIKGYDVAIGKVRLDLVEKIMPVYEIIGSKYNYRLEYDIMYPPNEALTRKILENIVVE